MVAVIWMATGRVESALSSAREWPISAAITACPTMEACISAEQKNSSQTCRFISAIFGALAGASASEMAPSSLLRRRDGGAPSASRATTSGGPSTKSADRA